MTRCVRSACTAALFASALAFGACDPMHKTPGAVRDPQPTAQYPFIAVEAPLQRYVGVDDSGIVVDPPTESRPLHVTVPLRSLADNQMTVQYEFTWFDADGRDLGHSGWQFLALEPRLQRRLSGNSLTSKATRWRLEVRSAR